MFKFGGELECGAPAPRVIISCMEFSHVMYESASQWVPAYDRLNLILDEANITMIDSTENAAIPIAVRYVVMIRISFGNQMHVLFLDIPTG